MRQLYGFERTDLGVGSQVRFQMTESAVELKRRRGVLPGTLGWLASRVGGGWLAQV